MLFSDHTSFKKKKNSISAPIPQLNEYHPAEYRPTEYHPTDWRPTDYQHTRQPQPYQGRSHSIAHLYHYPQQHQYQQYQQQYQQYQPPTRPSRAYSVHPIPVPINLPTSTTTSPSSSSSWIRKISLSSRSRSGSVYSNTSNSSGMSFPSLHRKKSVAVESEYGMEPVKERRPSLWTHHVHGEPRTVFRNAGKDEKGRLRPEYEEYEEVEW